MHLTSKGCVKNQFKMLEYYRVCATFESARDELSRVVFALPLGLVYYF
jgi:elongation factor P--beta-lysine ligase